MNKVYIIESSKDRIVWEEQMRIQDGDIIKNNIVVDRHVAMKEATWFKNTRYKDWPYVRITIEL